ncbi:replication restart helicase PriA [Caviibacter abscessus]|uniref:replication restart helicase PriA n=1 Tax=Caviibacter abscessus TaxID=1766719 RepID=UPI000836B08A|nr:primosomal protein N' [Caviibacter abscessus]
MYFKVQINKNNMTFTYSYPTEILKGTFCVVNFRNKETIGIVVGKEENISTDYEIKEILKVLDKRLDSTLFDLITWMSSYYMEPFGSLIPLITEPEDKETKPRKNTTEKKYIQKEEIKLTENQMQVVNDIENSTQKIHLINGVTGSGKTQIYISLIKKAIKEDKSCIILVPEISLTPQLVSKLEEVFGNKVALWHSKLTDSKKKKYYDELVCGEKKVVLGTRSALFCKLKNLGYIIIDEEQESSYKQEESPRYHVKNVAIKRVLLEDAKLILGSATPSFETYNQVKSGLIVEHKLTKRYNDYSMPSFEIVDLNNEKDLLTPTLIEKINDRIIKNEQVIILLNRKAHSVVIKCENCNNVLECNNCSTKLVYYKSDILKCNQCETKYKYKNACDSCGGSKLIKVGMGTEKLEDKLCELFDEEKILRMDSDSMNTNKKLNKAYEEFLEGKYNILIGTQIVAKGFHFPNVTLVCAINAEGINIVPDYKSIEKTYQLIVQASGRAGRESKHGEVLIQTLNPNSTLIESIVNNDYEKIFEEQMNFRKILNYPPYSKHIKILMTALNEEKLTKASYDLYTNIDKYLKDLATVYPVAHSGIYRISRRYRNVINIIFERENEKRVKSRLKKILDNINYGSQIRILVDVDANSMF